MSYSDVEDGSDVELVEDEDQEEERLLTKMVECCKRGNIAKVKEIVDSKDESYVLKSDSDGHSFLHWAALGGSRPLVEYLLEKGVPINSHSSNDYGPRPIHWACVSGHVVIVDLFLEKGVDIDTTDLNGCSPLLIAAQYGQSLVVSYLLQKGANRFHVDINGDSALHWAAFKGNPEVVFVLLNAGLNPRQKDSFQQTPLHSACIKGDIQCAEMLIEQGGCVEDVDSNGKTPRTLAAGRRHRQLVKFIDKGDVSMNFWDWRTLVFGPPGRTRGPVALFIALMLLWAYPMYFYKAVPATLETMWNIHLVFWVFNVFLWVMFIWCKLSDPGYIKPTQSSYDDAVKMIGDPTSWGDYSDMNNPIYNLCHSCKTVRPVRSKHCRQCKRCVQDFDHHCPWIDNCIGKKNRVPFTIFLHVLLVNALITLYFAYKIINVQGGDFAIYLGLSFFSVFFFSGIFMIVFQTLCILYNITTNERANYKRYRHFRTVDGKYRNPFNRGFLLNCMEYWNMAAPLYEIRSNSHIV